MMYSCFSRTIELKLYAFRFLLVAIFGRLLYHLESWIWKSACIAYSPVKDSSPELKGAEPTRYDLEWRHHDGVKSVNESTRVLGKADVSMLLSTEATRKAAISVALSGLAVLMQGWW